MPLIDPSYQRGFYPTAEILLICDLPMPSLAEDDQKLEALVESLHKTCTRYKIEISAEKTKLRTNSENGTQREIKVNGQKLVL